MEENRAVVELSLSETFEKINDNFGIFRTNAYDDDDDDDDDDDEKKLRITEEDTNTTTRSTMIKMRRSFDLNNESSKIKPLPKTKSLSSHFVVNFDEIAASFDGNNPHSNEERGKLLSVYGSSSSSSPRVVSDPTGLRNPRSDASAAIDEDEDEDDACGWRKVQIHEPSFGISLKFEDVNYYVRLKMSKVEKHIVQGVSGAVFPGEVLALMGPSGSGKTTLLNLLSGRVKCDGGIITYNNHLYTKSLKRRIGFVLQDDTVFPHLTVKETLTYSALLRLPKSLSNQQKEERAMDVLSQLGLERCQNTMLGGKFVRGVSGGEKKRVCIGNEILLNPSLLFLDEPTSSLDSTTALRIIQMLQEFAKAGKTVVTTIHQPSSRLFSKFDKLILLSNGSSLYFGKAKDAMKYFSSIGYVPLILMNPAEFLIDIACGNIKDKSVPSELKDKFLPSDVHKFILGAYESRASTTEKIRVEEFTMFDHKQNTSDAGDFGASWSSQFFILFKRGLKERRHEYLSSLRIIQVISTALIIGLIWWKSNTNMDQDQDQEGLLFFISVYWAFFPVFTAIFTFPLEKAMLAKERSVKMYKLSAYLLARNTSDLPLDLLLPIIFLTIIYFMVGLKLTFSAFSLTLLSIFLSIIAAQGLGLTIGAAFMDVKKATTLASVTVMTFMLSGGFFINKVPPFMCWIRYLSMNYHTYKLLQKIQYKFVGNDHGGLEVGAMVLMIFGYRLLTYILLRRMDLTMHTAA